MPSARSARGARGALATALLLHGAPTNVAVTRDDAWIGNAATRTPTRVR